MKLSLRDSLTSPRAICTFLRETSLSSAGDPCSLDSTYSRNSPEMREMWEQNMTFSWCGRVTQSRSPLRLRKLQRNPAWNMTWSTLSKFTLQSATAWIASPFSYVNLCSYHDRTFFRKSQCHRLIVTRFTRWRGHRGIWRYAVNLERTPQLVYTGTVFHCYFTSPVCAECNDSESKPTIIG